MNPKIFSVGEANALLTQLSSMLFHLQDMKKQIDLKQVEIDLMEIVSVGVSQTAGGGSSEKKMSEVMNGLNRLVEQYTKLFEELESMGPVIKDVDQGLIDFYHVRNQQLVFLCWKQGEPQIQHWHDLENGFQGRQVL